IRSAMPTGLSFAVAPHPARKSIWRHLAKPYFTSQFSLSRPALVSGAIAMCGVSQRRFGDGLVPPCDGCVSAHPGMLGPAQGCAFEGCIELCFAHVFEGIERRV